ncbi:hypothetical protein FRC12_012854 [Ceratobasidium sp. 428]|nr:hypothetical protein FRC12_012854 [Ceratobasidium sp. 428]
MDKVTSQMLLWLISNCEDSRLVDMALQSIAGVRPGFPVETLIETDVTEMLVQRLSTCLVDNPRTGKICLKPATSIEEVGLYVQALARLLESSAGFKPSFERQVPQLSYKQLDDFFNPHINKTIAELKNRFFDGSGENDNITTLLTSITVLPCYNTSADVLEFDDVLTLHFQAKTALSRYDQLIQSHLYGLVAIDSGALLPLLEATPHWIIQQTMFWGSIRRLGSPIMFLVQLIRSPSCSAPDFQYAIGLSLTVAAVLTHDYPGWEHPLNDIEDRATRALEVYRYYKVEHHVEPKVSVVFGLLGLLRSVLEAQTTFGKNEVIIIADVLTQIGGFSSIASSRIHTFSGVLTIRQHAKIILLENLQKVVDGYSDFGETAVIPCLMRLLLEAHAQEELDMNLQAALEAFLDAQSSSLRRRTCLKLLIQYLSGSSYSLESLEPAQISRLIDISLGDDAYSAPGAMMCLWNLTKRLIEAANKTPDGQAATVLADMLKHDAFASLRAKAPDLPVSPKNMFEVGLAEMWYPLLKEMKSRKYAAFIVNESEVFREMRYSDGPWDAIPYLEELRDGRSWWDILEELRNMPSCDVEV